MNNIRFSIILPSYNRAAFLPGTIESVTKQKYSNFELIIIDDGSTDNTEAVVAPYLGPNARYKRINNSERGAARNEGIKEATGDYITFLDSDDILYEDYLSNAAESLSKFNNPPFFHLGYQIIDQKGAVQQKLDYLASDDIMMFVKGNPLSCLGVFIRKDISDKFRFNEDRNLSGSEDWELWIRIVANYGIKVDNRISAALVLHDERSVLKTDETKLVSRKKTSLTYAFSDSGVAERFGNVKGLIESYCDSYIALHLALLGKKRKAFTYLLKAISNNILIFKERRFYSIIKHLILSH